MNRTETLDRMLSEPTNVTIKISPIPPDPKAHPWSIRSAGVPMSPDMLFFFTLFALENDRVDVILKMFGVTIHVGVDQVWP